MAQTLVYEQQRHIAFLEGYLQAYDNTEWFTTRKLLRELFEAFCIEEKLPLIDPQTLLHHIKLNPCYEKTA